MAKFIEPAEVFSETTKNNVNDNSPPTAIDDNPVLPIDISHLNNNSLSSENAVNTPTTPSLQDSLDNTGVDDINSFLNKPTSTTSTKQIEDYKIGDIVWAKIGKYPYWPSIVCVDPTLNVHYSKLFIIIY